MGEPLYEEVVGEDKLRRPCRIYAPVGSHETLLAYLVRRLLENGANTSFVNRIADPEVPVDDLIADPVTLARAISPLGAPHPKIALPPETLRQPSGAIRPAWIWPANGSSPRWRRRSPTSSKRSYRAVPLVACPRRARARATGARHRPPGVQSCRPPRCRRRRGRVQAQRRGQRPARRRWPHFPQWSATAPAERAAALWRAAELLESDAGAARPDRARGRKIPAECRRGNPRGGGLPALLRRPGALARSTTTRTARLGPVVCISPWNFPLAIFIGPGGRGAGGRKSRARQARRGDAA